MTDIDLFERGALSPVDRAVLAFREHIVTGSYAPERDGTNTAQQTIADTIRATEQTFGFERRSWPKALLRAAAPFDPLSQLMLGGTEARRVYTHAPASAIHPPVHVRTHRPHVRVTGTDWQPTIPQNDLLIPLYQTGE